MAELTHAFEPLRIRGLTLRNRIVCPPMNTNYGSKDGFVTERLVAFYRRIAEGGTGLVQVGACAISEDGLVTTNQIRADADEYIPGLKELFDAIKGGGALASIQLVHAGKLIHSPKPAPQTGPFPLGALLPVRPREWSEQDIQEIEEDFAAAAERVRRAGADMVTIHGAHHYILNEFMSPYFNERTDQYGGPLENRVKLATETLRQVKGRVGQEFPVIFRMSGADFLEGGLTLEDNKEIAQLLVKAGADVIDVSAGGRVTYGARNDPTFPPKKLGRACNVYLAEGIKSAVSVPVICVGNIWEMEMAETILAGGKADLVAVGRALIADPALVNKAKRGALDSIVQCTRCDKCKYFLRGEMALSCEVNRDL